MTKRTTIRTWRRGRIGLILLLFTLALLVQCGNIYTRAKTPTPPPGFTMVDRLVGDDTLCVSYPSFSADGRLIAFIGSPYIQCGVDRLYAIDLIGGRQLMVSEEEFWHTSTISPDGKWIAASGELSDSYRGAQLYLVEVESKTVSRLAEGAFPAWSPDGKLLAYALQTASLLDADCRQQIWVHALSIGAETKVFDANCVGGFFKGLVWSPDQAAMAFAKELPEAGADESRWGVYVLEVESGETRLVSVATRSADSPNFSPDSGKVMYRDDSAMDGDYLVVVDLSNGRCHRVAAPLPRFFEVKLSPDGRKIAFGQHHSILVADTDDVLGPDFWTVGEPCDDP